MNKTQVYSPAEVSLHTSNKSCWLMIHGKVYDVTNFLEDHPGGEDVLLHAAASGDASKDFDEVGHSSTAYSMMESYVIGTVEGSNASSEEIPKPPPRASGRTVQQKQPPSSSNPLEYLVPLLVLAVAFGAWYYLTIYSKANNKA